MDKKNYLVIVDTTDAKSRMTLPRGMLNAYIILALDPIHAKKILLSLLPTGMADQYADALYVYDISQISGNLATIDAKNQLPLFSFMPLKGGRPPKQNDVNLTQLGNETLESNMAPNRPLTQQQQSPLARKQGGGRSQEFQQIDDKSPTTSDKLNKEQQELVGKFGISQAREGMDEGVNLRINSSTGVNQNLTPTRRTMNAPTTVNSDQAELLSKLNVQIPEMIADPELMREIEEAGGGSSLVDHSLTKIEEAPLDDDALKRLQEE